MRKEKQTKRSHWKEYIYNSPYLIAVVVTSAVVMLCSDSIGVRAFIEKTQMFAYETYAKMPGREKQVLINSDEDTVQTQNAETDGNQTFEEMAAVSSTLPERTAENAGECKDNEDVLKDNFELSNENAQMKNAEKTEDAAKGVTNYEFYEPVQIDSRYYKDAGKVALTTTYPYTYENMSYFNDAAFLGDSRTLGISDYAGLEEADFYCDSGMMIFRLLEDKITYQKTGDKVALSEVLQEKRYGKIYIMLGMNELGYGDTGMYLEKYQEVIHKIREWQPDAILYIMANLHVSKEKNNLETEFNNININDKNAAAASLANGTDVFYLDANPLFTDEEGYLKAELTFDGVHLYAKHYDAWREFLLEHAVESEDERQAEEERAKVTETAAASS